MREREAGRPGVPRVIRLSRATGRWRTVWQTVGGAVRVDQGTVGWDWTGGRRGEWGAVATIRLMKMLQLLVVRGVRGAVR